MVGLQNSMRKRIVIMTLVLSLLLLAGCASPFVENEPKTVLDSTTVMVEAHGLVLAVVDKSTGTEYRFKPKLVRRSEATEEPVAVVSTPTLIITPMRRGVEVQALQENRVYIITLKRGGLFFGEENFG